MNIRKEMKVFILIGDLEMDNIGVGTVII